MTKKILFFMCILLNLTCMMLAALLYSLRNQGMAVVLLGQSINPTTAIMALMVLAIIFIIIGVSLVSSMRR